MRYTDMHIILVRLLTRLTD